MCNMPAPAVEDTDVCSFLNRNANRNDPTSVDLHGLHCDEAVEVLEEILLQAEHRMLIFLFLTMHNSKNEVSSNSCFNATSLRRD